MKYLLFTLFLQLYAKFKDNHNIAKKLSEKKLYSVYLRYLQKRNNESNKIN